MDDPIRLTGRDNVPDLELIADWVERDLADDEPGGFLDALGTLDGLTTDDLQALVIVLARRLADARTEA